VAACDAWEKATLARKVESDEVTLALRAIGSIREHIKVLCLALKGNCDPESDHICPAPPK
jgi:hypothetical protein